MHRVRVFGLFLLALVLTPVRILYAQRITITPRTPSVAVGKAVQFSAQITGLSNTAVTWSAGGVKGGNSTVGTITSTGLYTAAQTPPSQNPVQITATSAANSKISATTYVYLLTLGPTMTSVSPNPLPAGAFTVKIQGSGFQPGATVFDSYGSNPYIQLVTISVTPTSIQATGYQGSASSASFCVKNAGSTCSNSIAVPVTGGSPHPSTYTLTVVNGIGGGSYKAGTVVTITANPAPAGQSFLDWTGAAVKNTNASPTTLTMPASNATVTANYSSPTSYTLHVVNGTGSGTYAAGKVVTIAANAPPAGQAFLDWTGVTVQNPNASPTALTMPASNVTATANFYSPAVVPYPVATHPRLELGYIRNSRCSGIRPSRPALMACRATAPASAWPAAACLPKACSTAPPPSVCALWWLRD